MCVCVLFVGALFGVAYGETKGQATVWSRYFGTHAQICPIYVTRAGKTRLVILVPWILEFQAWIYDVAPSASQAQMFSNQKPYTPETGTLHSYMSLFKQAQGHSKRLLPVGSTISS